MRLQRPKSTLAAVVLVTATATVLTTGWNVVTETPAQAAYSDCPSNNVCLFDSVNGGNPLLFTNRPPGTCQNIPSEDNDRTDSFANRLNPSLRGGAHHIQLFVHANCQTPVYAEVTRTAGPFPSAFQSNLIQEDANRRQVGCQFDPPRGCWRNLVTSIFYNTGFTFTGPRSPGAPMIAPIAPTTPRATGPTSPLTTPYAAPMIPLGAGPDSPTVRVKMSYSQCPSGYVCLFEGTNGAGILGNGFYASPGTCLPLPYAYTDAADSFYNRLTNGHHVQFYETANCSGAPGALARRQSNGSGGPHAAGVRDNFLSSFCCTDRDEVSGIFFNRG